MIMHKKFSEDVIIESVCKENETDDKDNEHCKEKEQKNKVSTRDVLDDFDAIWTFLDAHDDNEASNGLSNWEACMVKLPYSKTKQTKTSDYFH